MSDFARCPIQERTKYGIHEMPPVQAFQASLNRLNDQLAEFGIKPVALSSRISDIHIQPNDDPCPSCVDLDKVEGEYPGDLHEGKELLCDDCSATYYEEWMSGQRYATNEQARRNHPELKQV